MEKSKSRDDDVPGHKWVKTYLGKWYNVAAAVFYGIMSMSAVVVNKAVMTTWQFPYPLTMIACQMAISFLFLYFLKKAKFITYADWSFATAKKAYPLAWAHVLNVLLGLIALNLVDIPMFSCLRRLTVLLVLVLEYIMLKKLASIGIFFSIFLMLIGAIIAGWTDLRYDAFGYALTLLVNVVNAFSLVLIPRISSAADLGPFGLMLYQVTLGFPFILAAAIYNNELSNVLSYPHLYNPTFQAAYLFSCLQIFLLNYSIFLCTNVNSPLTTTVTGQLKDLGTTLAGFVFFHVPVLPYNLVGIAIGMWGSVCYSYIKYLQQVRIQKTQDAVKDAEKPAGVNGVVGAGVAVDGSGSGSGGGELSGEKEEGSVVVNISKAGGGEVTQGGQHKRKDTTKKQKEGIDVQTKN